MKSSIASARNIAPFEILFRHPQLESLALSFLNAFFPFETVRFETATFEWLPNFHSLGAFEDKVLLKLEDTEGKKRFAEISLLEFHTDTLTFTTNEDFQSLIGENGLENLQGLTFNLLYFAGFKNTSTEDYHQFREFQLTEPPYHIRFDIYGLPEFKTPEAALQTDRDFWLFWLSNNRIPVDWTDRLMPLLDQSAWPDRWREEYNRLEKKQKSRRKNIVLPLATNSLRRQKKARSVTINWRLIEKDLDLITNRNIDKVSLNLDAVQEDLAAYAFHYFHQWSETCQEEFPGLNLEIENEQVIVKDFRHCLETAILKILKQKNFYTASRDTRSVTIQLDFHLQTSLNELWHFEYVVKQSTKFKSLTALRAIYSWLENNEVASIKLDNAYKHLIKDQINLGNPDISFPSLYPDQTNDDFRAKNSNRIVLSVLEHEIKTHKKLISDDNGRFFFYNDGISISPSLMEQLLKDNIELLM